MKPKLILKAPSYFIHAISTGPVAGEVGRDQHRAYLVVQTNLETEK